jgi:hypothetical protein
MQATLKTAALPASTRLAAAVALAASVAAPAYAQNINVNFTTLDPANGSFVTCTGTGGRDRCATGPGNAMSFTTGGLTVLATGLTRSSTGAPSNAVATQDHNGTAALPWIGLGVYAAGSITTSTDQIGNNDVLKLDFGSQMVSLKSLQFYNASHGTTFDTSSKWGLSLTAPTAGGTFTQHVFGANGLNDIPDIQGKTFYLYGLGSSANNQFYVGGVTVSAVPEPGTLGLMAAGLGVVSMVARRRKALVRG